NLETLDPRNWDNLRSLAYQMVDDMLDHLQSIRDKPIWTPMKESDRNVFKEPIPKEPTKQSEIYSDFKKFILPHHKGNTHPRFWGWVDGTGTPFGMLAEMLAAGMNTHAAGGNQAASYLEEQIIQWFVDIFKFRKTSSGLLVSGASMANLIGLAVARNAKITDVRIKGLQDQEEKYILYGSTETHSSVKKAIELLGFGSTNFETIAIDEQYRIITQKLEERIKADKLAGLVPICVIGNVGTVNTGSIDDLKELKEICNKYGLWLHVDGAFGALLQLSEQYKELVTNIGLADSLAFDFHKWMYMPYEAGCILINDQEQHTATFAMNPTYIRQEKRGILANSPWFGDLGVQLSRNFKALKIWMSIREHGIKKYGRMITKNIEQAKYLGAKLEEKQNFEVMAPIPLNVVCFRYDPGNMDQKALNKRNEEILFQIQESGEFMISSTQLQGKYVLRVCITNHRTEFTDIDYFLEKIEEMIKK
ncbi:MAG: pyridoxal phosphate-dependent decarboxylase family protein, partial [Candidatus Hodarchaeales archaeon]